MTEKEIRAVLQKFCADLDKSAKRVVRAGTRGVVPVIFGTGLAVASCGEVVEEEPLYGAPYTNSGGSGGDAAAGGMAAGGDGGAQLLYGAPGGFGGIGGDAGGGSSAGGDGGSGGSGNEGGFFPPYMAPFA